MLWSESKVGVENYKEEREGIDVNGDARDGAYKNSSEHLEPLETKLSRIRKIDDEER